MNYTEFQSTILEKAKAQFPDADMIEIKEVEKNNHVCLKGLVINETGVNISPTLYLDAFYEEYQNGASLDDVFAHILEVYTSSRVNENIELSFFTDFQEARSHISYKLVHYEKNKQMLETVPYIPYLDLAIVFYYYLPDYRGEKGSILIRNSHLELWKKTKEELYEIAQQNANRLFPEIVYDMGDIVANSMREATAMRFSEVDPSQNKHPFYVLTNSEKFFGASCILYPELLAGFAEKFQSSFYMLPSSIHEVILVPEAEVDDPEVLNRMISEVNSTEVCEDEFLSDHYYRYSIEEQRLFAA